MVKLTINGRKITAEKGTYVLYAARDNNIHIPTLCENEAVEPYGACRLCLAEIKTARGRERLVTTCLYPVEEGLTVRTDTERIQNIRRMLLELLLARCPDSEVIQNMAREAGVGKLRLTRRTGNNLCILCANCARTCEEVVGVSAISLAKRGVERELTTPFNADFSEACIGCGSCAYSCPTGAITVADRDGTRLLKWPHNRMDFKMRKCSVCGSYWAPEKQIEYIAKISGTPLSDYDACPDCRD
ncbi:MAG: 2Fe-2S iron-sulfur cluster-binding protein [Chloroflexota bacterium]